MSLTDWECITAVYVPDEMSVIKRSIKNMSLECTCDRIIAVFNF